MNENQVKLLVQLIKDVAEAVVLDNQLRGSDYAGMDLYRIETEGVVKFVAAFNEAATK